MGGDTAQCSAGWKVEVGLGLEVTGWYPQLTCLEASSRSSAKLRPVILVSWSWEDPKGGRVSRRLAQSWCSMEEGMSA